jgi:hypothetical protein
MAKTPTIPPGNHGPSHADEHPNPDEKKAVEESKHPTASRPGGFKNDPDDPTNPNEAIERARRHLRQ